MNTASIFFGKSVMLFSQIFNLGSGSTWPGHIALKLNKNFISDILKNTNAKIIIICGTNGKTTTGRLTTSIIRENNKTYLQNKAGANLVNGFASTLIRGSNLLGSVNKDYIIFESDENALSKVLLEVKPDYLICLNLFRDQLDRYGEVDSVAKKWQEAIKNLTDKTKLILNADDPQIAYLSNFTKNKSYFFGLEKTKETSTIKHGADTTHCPKCFEKLNFSTVFYSHLGIWNCPKCGLKRPTPDIEKFEYYPLPGTYNKYNTLAAALFAKVEDINNSKVKKAYECFTPAFGRGEKINYKNKTIQVFLSKNPTSFNESLSTVNELNGNNVLLVLNDRIPDGLDVSWIWDIDVENLINKEWNVCVAGDRVYDMGLRMKYADIFSHVEPDLEKAINNMTDSIDKDDTLYILSNYSAMLEVRRILTGKKIL